jgi:hypothetical protein
MIFSDGELAVRPLQMPVRVDNIFVGFLIATHKPLAAELQMAITLKALHPLQIIRIDVQSLPIVTIN